MLVVKHADPTTQTIWGNASDGPIFKSDGPVTFTCGRCEKVLLENVLLAMVQSIMIQCQCGAFNLSEV
jgi:hypothetical protein